MLTVSAGCGEKETRADDPPSTPTLSVPASPTPSIDPVVAGTQAALAAYRGMWDAFVAASNNGDTTPPGLAEHTSGSALQTLNKGLALNKSRGQITKGAPTMSPRLSSIGPVAGPMSATVTDCVDDSRWLLYKRDGQLADDNPGGRRHTSVTVTKLGDTWKVSTFAAREVGTC